MTAAYRAGSALARIVPRPIGEAAAKQVGWFAGHADRKRRALVRKNLERVYGRRLSEREAFQKVDQVFANYARYYHESFRLPSMTVAELDGDFSADGYELLVDAIKAGKGPILAMPHLGSWEWAGFWLTRARGHQVTCVVEKLEPPELFEWFLDMRQSLGLSVVPLGPQAGPAVVKAIAEKHITVLVCDRHVGDAAAVEVEFFGERTLLPAGPAAIALRTGAPVFPSTVYTAKRGCHAVVRPQLVIERQGKFRDDVARITQVLARELEILISAEPEQWHMMQPNWPSDDGYEAGR